MRQQITRSYPRYTNVGYTLCVNYHKKCAKTWKNANSVLPAIHRAQITMKKVWKHEKKCEIQIVYRTYSSCLLYSWNSFFKFHCQSLNWVFFDETSVKFFAWVWEGRQNSDKLREVYSDWCVVCNFLAKLFTSFFFVAVHAECIVMTRVVPKVLTPVVF